VGSTHVWLPKSEEFNCDTGLFVPFSLSGMPARLSRVPISQ
jgi:hypothetical protein